MARRAGAMTNGNGHSAMTYRWHDYRCTGTAFRPCNRLLLRVRFNPNVIEAIEIEIRCPRCSKMNVIGVSTQPEEVEALAQTE